MSDETGFRVVCIDGKFSYDAHRTFTMLPVEGHHYIVDAVISAHNELTGELGIGYKLRAMEMNDEELFNANRFKKIII